MDLERQLDEIEAIKSMYPEEEGCFVMAPAEQQAWTAAVAAGAAGAAPTHANLSGTIRLPGVLLSGQPVALRFQLPPGYPSAEPPLLSVECSASRSLHEQLSSVVRDAAEVALGSEALLLVLGALQDAATEAESACSQLTQPAMQQAVGGSNTAAGAADEQTAVQVPVGAAAPMQAVGIQQASGHERDCPRDVLQVVVWFHHIKSTEKRKNLVAWARELDLSGYSKPGFPGIVVVEGLSQAVREYLARVRALQWQAMQIRGERLISCQSCQLGCSGRPCSSVAGELNVGSDTAPRSLQGRFAELPESGMSELSQECKSAGLEDLFLAALKLNR